MAVLGRPGGSGVPGGGAAAAADLEETSGCCSAATAGDSVGGYSKSCLLTTDHLQFRETGSVSQHVSPEILCLFFAPETS